MPAEKPRIFISHAWEDKRIVRRLEKKLKEIGIEVWVDHSEMQGGDNIPKRVSDVLEWCNTFLLGWSKAANDSPWVEREWGAAMQLNKKIIPCLFDRTDIPNILISYASIDFHNFDKGFLNLRRTFQSNLSSRPTDSENSLHHTMTKWLKRPLLWLIIILTTITFYLIVTVKSKQPAVIIDRIEATQNISSDTSKVFFSIINPTNSEITITSIKAFVSSLCDSCGLVPSRAIDRYDLGVHMISTNRKYLSDPNIIFPVKNQGSESFSCKLYPGTALHKDYGECLLGYSAVLEVQYNEHSTSKKKLIQSDKITVGILNKDCEQVLN